MPHLRPRYLLKLLLRRRKLWPVIGLIGARQVGKSTLLRDWLLPHIAGKYFTLDLDEIRKRLRRSLHHFIDAESDSLTIPLILDEAQKIPELFDEIKAFVDIKRRPGRFFLSGSSEFSKRTGIRESLTGRMGINQLFPFTPSELAGRPLATPWVQFPTKSRSTAAEIENYLEKGGMPGICFLRDSSERSAAFEGWLDTTCFRDIQNIRTTRLDGQLVKDILLALPKSLRPTASEVSKLLRVDLRRISKHLEALQALLVLHRIDPHPAGIGKPHYIVFDCGLANYLEAPRPYRLRAWALNECLAEYEYSGLPRPKISYYESAKRSFFDMVIVDRNVTRGILIDEETGFHRYTQRTVEAFLRRIPEASAGILMPISQTVKESKQIRLIPWTAMA